MLSSGMEAAKSFASWISEQVAKLASSLTSGGDAKPDFKKTLLNVTDNIEKNVTTTAKEKNLPMLDFLEVTDKAKQLTSSMKKVLTEDKLEKIAEVFKTTFTSEMKKKHLTESDFVDGNGKALEESKLSESAKQVLATTTKIATEYTNKTIITPIKDDYDRHLQTPSTPAKDTTKEGLFRS